MLDKLEARKALTPAERCTVLALPHKVKSLRRHEFIVRENGSVSESCVLLSGFAMRHKATGNGDRQIFSIHMRGDLIDLHNSLLGRADHNVQMLSAGEAAFIPVEAIRALVASHPALAEAMWLETLVDAAIFREWTLNVGRRDARSRMSHMLCEFAVRLEAAGLGEATQYELPMTQGELSDTLALTPIHVNRTLRTLAAEGLVVRTNRSVRIVDWHALAKVGDFDTGYLHLPKDR
ncbi:MAG: Crp/Fnr family transcriptional regulator [Novosphingobium sp.]